MDGASLKNVQFNLGARVNWLDIGGFRSEWRTDIVLFSAVRAAVGVLPSLHIPPPTGSSRPGYWPTATRFNIYENNQLVSDYRRNMAGGGLDFGYQFGNVSELRVGYEGGWEGFERQTGNPNLLPSLLRRLCGRQGSVPVRSAWTMP